MAGRLGWAGHCSVDLIVGIVSDGWAKWPELTAQWSGWQAHIDQQWPPWLISCHHFLHTLFHLTHTKLSRSEILYLFVPEPHPGLSPWQKWGPSTLMQWSDAILHPTYCGWLDTEHDRQPPGSMSGLKATKDCMNQNPKLATLAAGWRRSEVRRIFSTA